MTSLDKLDAIATPKKPAAKKSSVPEYIATPDEKQVIDAYVEKAHALEELEIRVKELEATIIGTARGFLEHEAETGNFAKSVKMCGNTQAVRVTQTDRFSIGKDATPEALEELFGSEYERNFEVKRSVALKEEVLKNEELLNELLAKLGDSFAVYFNVEKKLVPKKGLDENLYRLPREKRAQAKALVNQAKPGVTVI